MMGGFIWLESELGKGSTFYFVACFEKGDMSTVQQSPARKSGVGEVFLNHSLISQAPKSCDGEKMTNITLQDRKQECTVDANKLDCDGKQHMLHDSIQEHGSMKDPNETHSEASISSQTPELSPCKLELNNPCLLFKGMNVLLAEDNVVNQKVVCQQLKKFGTVVKVVSDGQQCLEALEIGQEKYDLILMDVQVMQIYKQANSLYFYSF
jgi:osomolarity two-component system sensor histidine kinase NIK1